MRLRLQDALETALGDGDVICAVCCYANLRSAITGVDDLPVAAIRVLKERVVEAAAASYPDSGGLAQACQNAVLLAYAAYLQAVLNERKGA